MEPASVIAPAEIGFYEYSELEGEPETLVFVAHEAGGEERCVFVFLGGRGAVAVLESGRGTGEEGCAGAGVDVGG